MRLVCITILFINLYSTVLNASQRIGYFYLNSLFHLVEHVTDCHIIKEYKEIQISNNIIRDYRERLTIQYYSGLIEQSLKNKIIFLESQLEDKKNDLWEYKKDLFEKDIQGLISQLKYSYEIKEIYLVEIVSDLKGRKNFIPKKNWFNLTNEFLSVYNKEKRGVKYEVFRKKSCT